MKNLKNEKGVTSKNLIIIIVSIICAIIFIVVMFQPRDGIGSVREETKKLEEIQKRANETTEQREKTQKDYYNSLLELKELEEKYNN